MDGRQHTSAASVSGSRDGPVARAGRWPGAAIAGPLPVGKLPVELVARLLERLGPWPPEVRLGPAVGEDACALDVPAGVLVAATDPITSTGRDVGRLASP